MSWAENQPITCSLLCLLCVVCFCAPAGEIVFVLCCWGHGKRTLTSGVVFVIKDPGSLLNDLVGSGLKSPQAGSVLFSI